MKITIAGAAGRMGQMLIRQIAGTPGCSLAGAIEGAGSNALGRDAVTGWCRVWKSLRSVSWIGPVRLVQRPARGILHLRATMSTEE